MEKERLARLIEDGTELEVRYTQSVKSGRNFTYTTIVERCLVKGCWAFTSNGKKRVFEIIGGY